MSVKHFKKYYNEVCNQYMEMIDDLKEFEQMASNNIIEPERLESIKQEMIPLKSNYQTLSYISYLLNLPNKKDKQKKYERVNKHLLKISKGKQEKDIINENNKTLNNIKNSFKG